MSLVARPLAGPGCPGTALNVVEREGWTITHDEVGNAYVFPPDHRVIAAFLPERNDFAAAEALWVIRAYGDLNDVLWEATFTEETPTEFIAAFLADLTKSEPLDPAREDEETPVPTAIT
ncbi:hypothetical protein Airi01_074620 [Actinoallomurus iriomotensis]|uniref:DUF317 domain-containing protein n=1 Tax=Actinoallomurus iriomotensis TaxID=478107 RepID=A0A9W6RSN1_9ACTN|nr:hypothetical protein Airi01_074620 [Actinoallomurus iriomotensis]